MAGAILIGLSRPPERHSYLFSCKGTRLMSLGGGSDSILTLADQIEASLIRSTADLICVLRIKSDASATAGHAIGTRKSTSTSLVHAKAPTVAKPVYGRIQTIRHENGVVDIPGTLNSTA